jgi:hypothetical protein
MLIGVLAWPASASGTATSVTVAGSMQSELGCSGDWQPDCAASSLLYDAGDGVWQGTFSLPPGSYEYKAALNGSWDENYGLHAVRDGANIPLNLADAGSVKFYFDEATHWITDNHGSVIATVPGSFQTELGCPTDWDPGCLRSWLQDPDGDGIYRFQRVLPVGDYEAKVAINEDWFENYGAGGVPQGPNIPFSVAGPEPVTFSYDAVTHILTISGGGPVNHPPACTGVTASPATITPATRDQFKLVTLSGATDPDGDASTVTATGVWQDEPVTGAGDETTPDAALTGTGDQVLVRAERNPTGNGRVYRITFRVTDARGATCVGDVSTTGARVAVPRKKGMPAIDDGPAFNSLATP